VLSIAWFLPRHAQSDNPHPWRLRGLTMPRGLRGVFATATLAVTAAYTLERWCWPWAPRSRTSWSVRTTPW
jgi:hypothetical protein